LKDGIFEFNIPDEVLNYILSFVPLTDEVQPRAVCKNWFCAWNDEITQQINPLGELRSDEGFNTLWQSQQKEMEILLKGENKLLTKTNNAQTVVRAFQNLKEVAVMQQSPFALLAREKVLNKINAAIINEAIQASILIESNTLDCKACSLTRFPAHVIEDNHDFWLSIQSLDISHNHLTQLPENIGHCIRLKELKATNNNLTYLPDSIGKCVMLQTLNLDMNELSTLTMSICECRALLLLNVNNNRLIALPENIGHCIKLRLFFASWNNLKKLPESIVQCVALEWLKVSYNQLDELPEGLEKCVNLQGLCISHNHLKSLPVNLPENIFYDLMENGHISKEKVLAIQDDIVNLHDSVKKLKIN
jgi:hypothetical protein